MKFTSRLTRHINAYICQIIQQVFLIHIQLKQEILMSEEDDNASNNFELHEDEKSILEE